MAWIELHQTLPNHRKIMKLRRLLKIKTPQAVGHVAMLWLWSIDNAPDGDLSKVDVEDIAAACEWTKGAETFVNAMKAAELIDADMKLHDWGEYTGQLMERREERRRKDRERQARYRAKKAAQRAQRAGRQDAQEDPPTAPQAPPEPPPAPAPEETGPPLSKAMQAAAAVGRPELGRQVDPNLGKVMTFYMNRVNATPSQISIEELGAFAEVMDADVIIWAMQYAIDEHKSSWSYIRATLKAYKDQGIRTLADLQRANDAHERAKQRREDTRNNGSNRRSPAGRPAGPAEPPGDPLKGFSTGEE